MGKSKLVLNDIRFPFSFSVTNFGIVMGSILSWLELVTDVSLKIFAQLHFLRSLPTSSSTSSTFHVYSQFCTYALFCLFCTMLMPSFVMLRSYMWYQCIQFQNTPSFLGLGISFKVLTTITHFQMTKPVCHDHRTCEGRGTRVCLKNKYTRYRSEHSSFISYKLNLLRIRICRNVVSSVKSFAIPLALIIFGSVLYTTRLWMTHLLFVHC